MEKPLPPDFLAAVRDLESSYLQTDDPIFQSGFGGGAKRWREEREPILEAINEDGELLDIGCANGYLLECLVSWGREQNLTLIPYGVDLNLRLVEVAKNRLPTFKEHFFVVNAWEWVPEKPFKYVYTLSHCVPDNYLEEYLRQLLTHVVVPGGKLIVGDYGSRSQGISPVDFRERLGRTGLIIQGAVTGGKPPTSSFAWIVKS